MDLKEALRTIKDGEETIFDVSGPTGDRKITVNARKLLPEAPREPTRAESPARKHEFHAADSLGQYLARYGDKGTVVFADVGAETISAVLEEKEAGGFEIVTMKPQAHPLWKPWAEIAGKTLDVDDFAEFAIKNRRAIVAPDGRELAFIFSQIRASVEVRIERGRGKKSLNGVMVKTDIQGVKGEETVEIPETIKIRVPLYVATAPRDIEIDLSLSANTAGDVSVLVSAGTVAEARVEAFEEMVAAVGVGVAALGAVLTFGKPQHEAWKYLPESVK